MTLTEIQVQKIMYNIAYGYKQAPNHTVLQTAKTFIGASDNDKKLLLSSAVRIIETYRLDE